MDNQLQLLTALPEVIELDGLELYLDIHCWTEKKGAFIRVFYNKLNRDENGNIIPENPQSHYFGVSSYDIFDVVNKTQKELKQRNASYKLRVFDENSLQE